MGCALWIIPNARLSIKNCPTREVAQKQPRAVPQLREDCLSTVLFSRRRDWTLLCGQAMRAPLRARRLMMLKSKNANVVVGTTLNLIPLTQAQYRVKYALQCEIKDYLRG